MMTCLIPKIFYADIRDGFDLFVGCLGFSVLHQDEQLMVVGRDGVKAYLVQDVVFAAKDRPELTIETDTIHALFDDISSRRPYMLQRNAAQVRRQPWGSLEFVVRDPTGVCVVFRQW